MDKLMATEVTIQLSKRGKVVNQININAQIFCHAALKFAEIMKLDGIMPQDISRSVAIKDNIHNIFASKEGSGRSGSFFFFSADK